VALGYNAGNLNQGTFGVVTTGYSVAIGTQAGEISQRSNTVAVGYIAGQTNQQAYATAVGYNAGNTTQGFNGTALGNGAGATSQGVGSTAIGAIAGQTNQLPYATAVGYNAGNNTQGISAVAVGNAAGQTTQLEGAVAVGTLAGSDGQGIKAVAVGFSAGNTTQSENTVAIGNEAGYQGLNNGSVAIGSYAGKYGLGSNSIAIGNLAGPTGAAYTKTIVLNASGTGISPNTGSAFYVNPVRGTQGSNTYSSDVSNTLFYNAATSEISYAPTILGTYVVQGILSNSGQTLVGAADASLNFVISGVSGGYDPNGWWNTTTRILQPTVAGYYKISCWVTFPVTSSTIGSLFVKIFQIGNTTPAMTATGLPTATAQRTLGGDKIIYLNGTTDRITFTAGSADGAKSIAANAAWFSCNLVQPAKTFIIDHPLDPSRHLVHACLEGPEIGVFYRGKGRIAEGASETTIRLPPYVHAFAYDFTVQITSIGKVQLFAASEVVNGEFQVYGTCGAFYWHVHASRGELEVEPLRSAVTVQGSGPYKWIV
jgi:hypothetical protein